MKKYLIGLLCLFVLVSTLFISVNKASALTLSDIDLLISMGLIPSDKADMARAAFSTQTSTTTPPVVVVTPTQTPPVAKVTGTPTLVLTYDSSKKESQLTVTFSATVATGNQIAYIYQNSASVPFTNQTDTSKNFYGSGILTPVSKLSSITDQWGRTLYVLPANQTTKFTVTSSSNPKIMFAGSYTASLQYINGSYSTDVNSTGFGILVPANKTNSKTIVGELSPYITSVTQTLSVGDVMTITGSRIIENRTMNLIYIDGNAIPKENYIGSNVSTYISFTLPNLTVGSHYVQVSNASGMSNMVYFTVSGPVSSNLPPVINGITAPTALNVGQIGTWTVQASDPQNGQLHYGVDWGDSPAPIKGTAFTASAQQVSTFTHSYSTSGTYTVKFQVSNDSSQVTSTSATVQVGSTVTVQPTANVTGTPTLKLTYDSAQKESQLTATFNVSISAGSQAVNIFKNGGYVGLMDQNGKSWYTNSQKPLLFTPVSTLQTTTDQYGNSLFIIPAGKTAQFTVSWTGYPKELFAGTYYVTLKAISASPIVNDSYIYLPDNKTNSKTIVGETSPYISSATVTMTNTGVSIDIKGVRFSKTYKAYVDGVVPTNITGGVYGGGEIILNLQTLSAGSHAIQVIDSTTGASNNYYFMVPGSVSTQPSITSISPQSGSAGSKGVGDPIVTIYGSGFNQSSKILIGDNSYSNPLDPISVSSDGTKLTFTFPASGLLTLGTYSVRVSNVGNVSVASGLASNYMIFTIVAPTSTQSSLSVSLKTGSGYSPLSQFVDGGTSSVLAYYNFVSTSSSATISQLTFTTQGSDALEGINSITVNGVSAPVVNGSATITGLNINVPQGYAGISVPVTVQYNSVSMGGIQSGGTIGISLSGAKYSSVSTNLNVSSNLMTLVSSKPTVGTVDVSRTSGSGKREIARVIVSADANGPITLKTLPLSLQASGSASAGGSGSISVQVNGSDITSAASTMGTVGTAVTTTNITFNNGVGYDIAAGSSVTFRVYDSVTISQSGDSILSSLGVSSAFGWTDMNGSASFNGTLIQNYPINLVNIMSYDVPVPTTTSINGTCGSAQGQTIIPKPTANLCTTGTASTPIDNAGLDAWMWSCQGINGGMTASCNANDGGDQVINGACGSANGVTTASAPTTNLCSAGVALPVSNNTGLGSWMWGCSGSSGGTTVSCSAPISSTPPAAVTCTSFTYSAWSTCSSAGTQTETVVNSTPTGCTGGAPVLSQSCTVTPPVVVSDDKYCKPTSTSLFSSWSSSCGSKSAQVAQAGVTLANGESIDLIKITQYTMDRTKWGARTVTCPLNTNYRVCVENANDGGGNYILLGVKRAVSSSTDNKTLNSTAAALESLSIDDLINLLKAIR